MEQPGKEGSEFDWDNFGHQSDRRKLSETISITTPTEENGNYDTEATTAHPKRDFFKKVKSNVSRAFRLLAYSESQGYSYADYPIGCEYKFKDWETW